MTVANLAPGVFEIPFQSDRHKQVLRAFKHRVKVAREAQRDKRAKKWADSEDAFMAYMPEDELTKTREGNRKSGLPQYTTIAVPYSYAMLLTAHTYYTSVFLSRQPVLQVQGRHGEAQNAEQAIEAMLDYQLSSGGGLVPLFIWLLDPGKYGHGILGHYWDEEIIPSTQYVDEPVTFMGVQIPGKTKRTLRTVDTKGYVGNRLFNVRPQDFLTDPRYPMYRFQEGEYCILYDLVGWNKIKTGQVSGKYFNVDVLKSTKLEQTSDNEAGSPRIQKPGDETNTVDGEGNPYKIHIHEFHWEIIPADLGLGTSQRPEKWVFTIGNESVVISAQPLGLSHGKFPFDVLTNEIDGYSLYNRSMFEILDPLNKTMEWLFNSHFFNVRAALNNQFIVDPSKVVMKDIEDPQPGKMIRLKPAAFGSDVRSILSQLPVADITRANLSDTEQVGLLAQRIVGVTDNVMGMVNAGGRKTATEVRTSTTFGVNRLKTMCEWQSALGFSPLTYKLIASTQQLYDLERKYRIAGDVTQWGEKYINIAPNDLQGTYDFVPVDGTMPVDRYAQANLWQQLLGQMRGLPPVMMAYDIPKIFAFVAQLAGLKNINQFRVQVLPDQKMAAMTQAGNMVPMGGVNLNEPGQVPGMGSTG